MRNTYRQQVYNRQSFFKPILGMSKRVFPGDSFEGMIKGTMETDVIASLRVPAIISHYAFYVPHRLVMSNFTDFIADADTVITIPTTTNAFAEIGDGTVAHNALFRRSVKLVYNTFFGDVKFGANAWYTDPLNDAAQNFMLRLKTVNQILSAVALDTDEPADNYTVVASTIEMTEFKRRIKQNTRQNSQRVGGEKYSDALARYGVKVADGLINQPEMLGMTTEVVYPQEVAVTSEVSTGTRIGKYRAAVRFPLKRCFASEHGYIFTLHCIRPFLSRPFSPAERTGAVLRRFFMEEAEKTYVEVPSLLLGTGSDVEPDPLIEAYGMLDLGDMHAYNGVTGTLAYAANSSMADLIYPQVTGDPKIDIGLSCEVKFNSSFR